MLVGDVGELYSNSDPFSYLLQFRYRNFLMACAVLMVQPFEPMYFPLIDGPIPPGIQNLQKWIESAWEAGMRMSLSHYRVSPLMRQDSMRRARNNS